MATSNLSAADRTRQAARQMMRVAADKTKIASARTMKGETHVNRCTCLPESDYRSFYLPSAATPATIHTKICSHQVLHMLQEIDIAVVKATAAQFHVVPKEKHVRSKLLQAFCFFVSRHC